MTSHLDTLAALGYLDTIVTGDARELSKAIPDASVSLVFADPVYQNIDDYRWLAETAARVLKPEGHALIWQGVTWIPETVVALGQHLHYRYTFNLAHSNACIGTVKANVYSLWTPLFWYSKDAHAKTHKRARDFFDVPLLAGDNPHHTWQKSAAPIVHWMDAFTYPNAIIFDPFTGGGTIPSVAKMLGRHYIGFEIDPDTAERARQRVALTQVPLPLEMPEQMQLLQEAQP